MAPLTTFIGTIKGWHAIALFAFTLTFMAVGFLTADRATPAAERLRDGLLAFIGLPIMLVATAFLVFALFFRHYSAGQLFPSVFLAISAFVAVGITGATLNDEEIRPAVAVPVGVILSLLMSGMIVGLISVYRKIAG